MPLSTLSQLSLAGSSPPIAEEKIVLWSADGTSVGGVNSWSYIQDGSTTLNSSSSASAVKIHTLNPNWPVTQKFALEATIYASNAGSATQCQLVDVTSTPTVVSGSLISTTSTTATVVRSGQFTLTPGHIYALQIYNAVYTPYLVDAHLVVFP